MPWWISLLVLCQGMWLQAAKPNDSAKPEAMITRVFHVPRDFVTTGIDALPQTPPIVPFASPKPPEYKPGESVPLIKTSSDILSGVGIIFPAGASATFDPFSCTLTVINTQANLDLCEAYFDSCRRQNPYDVTFVLTVVEGPGEMIRAANAGAATQEDAAKELAALLQHAAKAESQVRVVHDAYLETTSGTRATTRSQMESIYPMISIDDQSHLTVDREMQTVGMSLEIEPTIGADGQHIDLTYALDLNPAPPSERQVAVSDPATGNPAEIPFTTVPMLRFTSSTRVVSGSTRLLGISKPYGKAGDEDADVLWAAFLTTHSVRLEPLMNLLPQAHAAPLKVPSGMKKVAFRVHPGVLENEQLESEQALQQYLDTHGIEPAAGADAILKEEVLTLVNTKENIERIVTMVDHLTRRLPKTVVLTLQTVQGSGSFLRGLAAQAAAQKDHGAQWSQLQQAMSAGEHDLKSVSTSRLETKSGVQATLESVQEHAFLAEYGKDKDGHVGPQFEIRRMGSILEFYPVISAWDDSMELRLSHEFHPLPSESARVVMLDPGSKQTQNYPFERAHVQQTTTSLHLNNGATRLLSLLKPTGVNAGDQLLATFLLCDVVPQSTVRKKSGRPLAQMLESVAKSDSKEQYTRSFRVPPDFLSGGESATHAEDPFAASSESGVITSKRKTAKVILEEAGIPFPEGAGVHSGGANSQLVVRNTQENLDKVEQYVEWMVSECRPAVVAMTSHVLEAPGPLVRQLMAEMGSRGNHRAELDQLLEAVRQGKARHLGLSRIETTPGSRVRAEQGVQYPVLSEVLSYEVRLVGLHTELEVRWRPRNDVVNLSLASEFHTAGPLEHREHVIDVEGRRLEFPLTDFHVMKLATETAIPDGNARLLAVWKPVGKPEWEKADILQVMFITCDLVRTPK
ncbi:hypothetical protein [Prosthecobacter sp.]|uniref:hypothetical protein n=1 Tax=Prosthecobacter sp. TaxID=1965333 RepID=UPI00260D482E|nr:hypothetical protein [Prosthecobacter sp.]